MFDLATSSTGPPRAGGHLPRQPMLGGPELRRASLRRLMNSTHSTWSRPSVSCFASMSLGASTRGVRCCRGPAAAGRGRIDLRFDTLLTMLHFSLCGMQASIRSLRDRLGGCSAYKPSQVSSSSSSAFLAGARIPPRRRHPRTTLPVPTLCTLALGATGAGCLGHRCRRAAVGPRRREIGAGPAGRPLVRDPERVRAGLLTSAYYRDHTLSPDCSAGMPQRHQRRVHRLPVSASSTDQRTGPTSSSSCRRQQSGRLRQGPVCGPRTLLLIKHKELRPVLYHHLDAHDPHARRSVPEPRIATR